MITSPNYPTFTSGQNCNRKIIAGDGKQIRIFLTDLSIEAANGLKLIAFHTSETTIC